MMDDGGLTIHAGHRSLIPTDQGGVLRPIAGYPKTGTALAGKPEVQSSSMSPGAVRITRP